MSLVSSNNIYYNKLISKMTKYNRYLKPSQKESARTLINLALRAGYRQAQIDTYNRETPKYIWDDDEEEFD